MNFLRWLFGGGMAQAGEVVQQVGGVFRPNAEAQAERQHEFASAALKQYAAEFQGRQRRTWFDSLMDGLNRMVRPLVTVTVLGVIPAVMMRPQEMAVAFAALALLPTGYWALVSIIVGFYYGGRMQLKAQDFERSVTDAVQRAEPVLRTVQALRDLRFDTPGVADTGTDADLASTALDPTGNPAVADWREQEAEG